MATVADVVPIAVLRPRSLTTLASSGRSRLVELYDAAITGASPAPVTADALRDFPAKPDSRIWIYAVGKAAHPMAAAACATLQRALLRIAGGIIVSDEAKPPPYPTLAACKADHPLPGRGSFTAAERIGEIARGKRSDDISIVLISGGCSSLLAAPLRGMAESDLGQLFELLLASGLDITATNAIRKRFTRWGAGRLALALAPSRTCVFAMSDVLGDDPATIGSGPCSPDDRTFRDVTELLSGAGLLAKISPAMREYLTSVGRGVIPETPKRTHPAFAHVATRVIGSNRLALDAVRLHGKANSLDVECVNTSISGDAAASGTRIADALLERAEQGRLGAIVWGGETTVKLAGGTTQGLGGTSPPAGGRCQELALAAAKRLSAAAGGSRTITLLAAGTDGRDGSTDAAGAFADSRTWRTIQESGRDPQAALERHDSHSVLKSVGALLPRRHTGTNVMDVVIGLVE